MEACRFLALLADPSGVLYEVSPHREPLDKTRFAPVGNRYGSPCATIHTSVYPLSVGVRATRAPRRPSTAYDPASSFLIFLHCSVEDYTRVLPATTRMRHAELLLDFVCKVGLQ